MCLLRSAPAEVLWGGDAAERQSKPVHNRWRPDAETSLALLARPVSFLIIPDHTSGGIGRCRSRRLPAAAPPDQHICRTAASSSRVVCAWRKRSRGGRAMCYFSAGGVLCSGMSENSIVFTNSQDNVSVSLMRGSCLANAARHVNAELDRKSISDKELPSPP